MTDAVTGWGAEFHLMNDAVTPALVELEEVFNMGLPTDEAGEADATHYKSPNRRRELIGTLIDGGEITVEMNYVAGSATDILLRGAIRQTRACRWVIPNGETSKWQIDGEVFLKGYERAIPLEDRLTAVATFRVTGDTTEAAYVAP